MTEILNKVVEILTSLGINSTFFYQIAIFFIAYMGMSNIVFKPYLLAYNERQRRTVGSKKEAESLNAEADKIEKDYVREARELNDKIKNLFGDMQAKATKEKAQIIEAARSQAEANMKTGRDSIEQAMSEARGSMQTHITEISEKIQNKFVGKQ